MLNRFLIALPAAVLAMASPALAHPKLVSSTPAANATVTKPTSLTLNFSEKLLPPMSGIELTMTGMPGMANHAPMKVAGFKTVVANKSMVATLPRALDLISFGEQAAASIRSSTRGFRSEERRRAQICVDCRYAQRSSCASPRKELTWSSQVGLPSRRTSLRSPS